MRLISFLIFLCISVMPVMAQVAVEAEISSVQMLIGEQVQIKLKTTAQQDKKVEMPFFKPLEMITPGVEVINTEDIGTENLEDKTVFTRLYTITSFEDTLYYIPPFQVKVDGKQYESNTLALKVITLDVDTTNVEKFYGPKDVQDNPFLWAEWSTPFWLSVIAAVLFIIIYLLYIRLKDNKPIVIRIKVIKKLLPHQKAMREIEQIKADKMVISENQKEYYTKLTETLRRYIEERYGFSAMEMTSSEIIHRLTQANDATGLNELKSLFETADLVKFAKHSALINENDMNLVNAIDFINSTKIENMPTDGLAMLELLRERLTALRTQENSEALYLLCKTIDQIEKVIGQYPQLTFTAEAVMQILRMLTKDMTIPYVGEPLNGLQVMGVLETRALDFDNIIITGFNDELYPGRSHSNSFIPYILRRGFGLPTPERQNAIFAYNFYRMLSYAQHVWLITNSTADEQHSGEVSRYLYQLKWQYHIDVEHVNVTNTLSIPAKKEEDIIKTDIVMEMLRQWQEKPLSASALNKYLYCPKQFYYRYVIGIHEPPKEEDIVASGQTIGNVLHHIMQQLYTPFEKKNVSLSDLRNMLDSLTEERWLSLLSELEGDILAMQITKSYVRNILLYDMTRAPFFYEGSECVVKRDLQVPDLGTFHFLGYIDRLDKRDGLLNIIDYKTGGAELEFKDMAHVFHRSKNQDKALQTLLYCWMIQHSLPHLLTDRSEMVPHIYPVRSMAKTEAVQTMVRAKGVTDFTFTPEVERDFVEGVINLLQEIFNPEIPFVATTEGTTRCKSCAFISLCKG